MHNMATPQFLILNEVGQQAMLTAKIALTVESELSAMVSHTSLHSRSMHPGHTCHEHTGDASSLLLEF